jgi:ubiquinone/menaquinone biosynthesis C-methylase UbiE
VFTARLRLLFSDSFFDVVHLSTVLEHLPNPRTTFDEIYRILRPDGLVYVKVPNTQNLVFRLFGEKLVRARRAAPCDFLFAEDFTDACGTCGVYHTGPGFFRWPL